MSDLADHRRDQRSPPNPRLRPVNRLARDRRLRFSDLAVTLFVMMAGCAPLHEPVTRDEVHRPEFWVDAFSPSGGDGSSARPFKVVPQPVPAGAILHLRAGLYPGPFVLPAGARLDGLGEVVLTGEADQTVVSSSGATLEGVSVQGGALGLEVLPGMTTVTRVHFSGQRRQAAVVHGALTLRQARFEASVEGIDGVSVDRGAQLELSNAKFTGGFRRAVMTEGGTLELQSVTGEGVKTLVHAVEGASRLRDVHSMRGSGPALFFAAGSVSLTGAEVSGHEFAVLLARGVEAQLSGVHATGALQACIAAGSSMLRLSSSTLTGCGPGGALSLMDSRTEVIDVEISAARELGVFVKKGRLGVLGLKVSKVSGSGEALGDALHVRDEAVVTGSGAISFSDVEGSGIFASSFSEVRLKDLTVERARSAALFAERGAKVTIGNLLVRGGAGAAVVVPDAASVELESLSVAGGNEMPIYAECQAGAKVRIGRLESTVQQLPSECVRY